MRQPDRTFILSLYGGILIAEGFVYANEHDKQHYEDRNLTHSITSIFANG